MIARQTNSNQFGSIILLQTLVCISAIARSPLTHSCLALASVALNFNMSPEAQLMVNVRESSSLGHTTAAARCAYNMGDLYVTFPKRFYYISIRPWLCPWKIMCYCFAPLGCTMILYISYNLPL